MSSCGGHYTQHNSASSLNIPPLSFPANLQSLDVEGGILRRKCIIYFNPEAFCVLGHKNLYAPNQSVVSLFRSAETLSISDNSAALVGRLPCDLCPLINPPMPSWVHWFFFLPHHLSLNATREASWVTLPSHCWSTLQSLMGGKWRFPENGSTLQCKAQPYCTTLGPF